MSDTTPIISLGGVLGHLERLGVPLADDPAPEGLAVLVTRQDRARYLHIQWADWSPRPELDARLTDGLLTLRRSGRTSYATMDVEVTTDTEAAHMIALAWRMRLERSSDWRAAVYGAVGVLLLRRLEGRAP